MRPAGLLRCARLKPLPDYPPGAVARAEQGVAVAYVAVGTNGRVEEVRVLQAPSGEIAAAVEAAVRRWEFDQMAPQGSPNPVRIDGKVVLYFEIQNGRGHVVLPVDEGMTTAAPAEAKEIDERELSQLLARGQVTLLSIRDRERKATTERAGSVHIPLDELESRAPRELDRGRHIVVDCGQEPAGLCRGALIILGGLGYTRLSVLKRR
jgi:TonB family protein